MKDYVQFIDSKLIKVVRLYSTGGKVEAKMQAGPKGMAMASFPKEAPFETEIPNVALTMKPLRGSDGKGVKKRPAAAMKGGSKTKAVRKKPAGKGKKADEEKDDGRAGEARPLQETPQINQQ